VGSVSAIIPVYNGRQYLREAVESVLRQTLPPCELILVDDGSRDDSLATIADIQAPFPIVRLAQANAGQSAARNYGAAVARGEYLAFLDQDDRWYPNHLARLVPVLDRDPLLGWAYSNVDEIDAAGQLVTMDLLDDLPVRHPKRTLAELLRQDMFIVPGSAVIRKTAFDAVGGFDPRLIGYEDDDLFLRLFRAGWRHAYVRVSTLQWRIYPHSTSYTPKMAQSRRLYADKLLATYPDQPHLNRYWARDCIAPRFFNTALGEYFRGLRQQDWALCAVAYQDMHRYLPYFDPGRKLRWKLRLMAHPQAYARLYRWKHRVPFFLRRWLP
jgi:glycosyltransferase involved in cell wall biosynthesis